MATPIVMPRQGNTVESCTIVQWHKRKGDKVAEGELLFTYETDKASFEFQSPVSGTLLDVFFATDQDIPVLTNVAAVGEPGESCDSLRPAGGQSTADSPAKPSAQEVAAPAKQAAAGPSTSSEGSPSGSLSPRARSLAALKGVDTQSLSGSGPHGRVIERDVQAAAAQGPQLTSAAAAKRAAGGVSVPPAGTGIGGRVRLADLVTGLPVVPAPAVGGDGVAEVKLSKIRKLVAERMMASLNAAAQLTMNAAADATALLAFRAKVKARAADLGLQNITITDMVAYALTRVLPKFPDVNATIEGDTIRQFRSVNLALAVDTPRGLMVPVVRGAERLALNDLALALKTVAAQCQDGSISPDLLAGGTLTITNLGMFGIESFTPILNAPQVAILGLNAITPRAVLDDSGATRIVPHIGLSLTIDHRALDGAPAARFLKTLVGAIESFELTLAM